MHLTMIPNPLHPMMPHTPPPTIQLLKLELINQKRLDPLRRTRDLRLHVHRRLGPFLLDLRIHVLHFDMIRWECLHSLAKDVAVFLESERVGKIFKVRAEVGRDAFVEVVLGIVEVAVVDCEGAVDADGFEVLGDGLAWTGSPC